MDKVLRKEEVDLLLIRVGGRRNCKEVIVAVELKCISQSNRIYNATTIIAGAKSNHINFSVKMPQEGIEPGASMNVYLTLTQALTHSATTAGFAL